MEENEKKQKYKESVIMDSVNENTNDNNTLIESTLSKEKENVSSSNNNNYEKKDSSAEFKEKELSFKPAKDKEDNIFKRKILEEEWFQYSKYADIDKVQDHLSSFKYLWVECENLEVVCTEQLFNHAMKKQDLFESQNVRTIVRNGIPPKYMRRFILGLFHISKNEETLKNNYKKILNLVLKGYKTEDLGNYVPCFTGLDKFEDSLPVHYLNNSGILALKEILWMLYQLYPNIECSPLIIQVLSMILVFCNKYEALEVMSCILCLNINYDTHEIYKIRWHLRFNYNDNIKIITSISDCLKEVSYITCKEIFEHMKGINFRPEKLYEDMCFGFFYKYFNFFGMIRLLPFYLHDGIKSFYRLIYAFQKITKSELLLILNPDKIISKCKELCNSLDNIKDLFEISYNLNITRNNNKYINQADIADKASRTIKQYYLPEFNNETDILKDYDIIHLWEILPNSFKSNQPTIIYSYKENENLSDIINVFKNENRSVKFLFLIKTEMKEIFGFSMIGKIENSKEKFMKITHGFLFSVEPEIKIYNKTQFYPGIMVFVDNDKILFGQDTRGNITLKINGDLLSGEIHQGECFDNPCLINKDDGIFNIEHIEIIKI